MGNETFICLVDDHILLRTGLASVINSLSGYKVLFEADNGMDFINQLKPRSKPDIVLLDITMPIMDGYETAEWIKVNLPETKILVLSMMEKDTAIIRMLKLGVSGYILKDSRPKAFMQALDNVRDNGYFLNELISIKMLKYVNNDRDGKTGTVMLPTLSDREITFLKYACTEKTYKEIAAEMCVSPRTVDSYRDNLFEKLEVTSRVGLVLFSIRNGIVSI